MSPVCVPGVEDTVLPAAPFSVEVHVGAVPPENDSANVGLTVYVSAGSVPSYVTVCGFAVIVSETAVIVSVPAEP